MLGFFWVESALSWKLSCLDRVPAGDIRGFSRLPVRSASCKTRMFFPFGTECNIFPVLACAAHIYQRTIRRCVRFMCVCVSIPDAGLCTVSGVDGRDSRAQAVGGGKEHTAVPEISYIIFQLPCYRIRFILFVCGYHVFTSVLPSVLPSVGAGGGGAT